MAGWVSLHRDVENHWLFQEERKFSKFEAWVDILLMVNHKDKKILLGNDLITVKRGQRITSLRKLSERWDWSLTKVDRFLKLLEDDEMITLKKDSKKTVITVVKYDIYQNNDLEKRHEKDTNETQTKRKKDTNDTRTKTNNNDNNELIMSNNDNNEQQTNAMREIISVYENNGYGTVGQFVTQDFSEWLDQGFEKESIIHALEIGTTKNNRTMKYVRGIVSNWKKQNTKTLSDIQAAENKRSYSRNNNSDYQLTPEQQAQVDKLGF